MDGNGCHQIYFACGLRPRAYKVIADSPFMTGTQAITAICAGYTGLSPADILQVQGIVFAF